MNELPPEIEELLLAFLDSDLPPHKQEELQQMIDADPKLAEYLELQGRLEESIRRVFIPPEIDPSLLRAIKEERQPDSELVATSSAGRVLNRRLLLTSLATAASIAVAVFSLMSFLDGPDAKIAYRQRPLVDVYEDCVRDGFEPYWVCDDPARFAATFERREGVRLRLASLPEGQKMLGLAYLAGLSHDSTSLLATVDGERVIVIIDKAKNDWRPETGEFKKLGLQVSRWERFGLVFYQVSPPGTPLLTDAFELADNNDVPRREQPSERGSNE